MSVDNTTRKQTFNMGGGVTTFEFAFRALRGSEEDIKCKTITTTGTITLLTYGTDYTVQITPDGGGTVTVADPNSTGTQLMVYRETSDLQESDYNDYNQFPADTVENDFDKRTMKSQEMEDDMSRTIKFPITSNASDIEFPTPSSGQVLVWSGTGGTLVNSDFAVVSAYTFGNITVRTEAMISLATIGSLIVSTSATIAALTVTTINVSSGTIAGAVTGVTQSAKDNSTKLATTAYVDATATENETFGSLTVKTKATIALLDVGLVTAGTVTITTKATVALLDATLATIGTITVTSVVPSMDFVAATVASLLVTTSATIAALTVATINISSGTIASVVTGITQSPDDNSTKLATTEYVDALTGVDLDKTYTISPSGGDYTTIQAALNANATDDTLFIVYPGTYATDTINFTANNQCIVGAGLTPQATITNTAQICDFGAFTGCRINNIKLVGTYTSAIDMITGSGQIIGRDVHLEVKASGTIGGSPTVVNTTGRFKQVRGSLVYSNSAISIGQIKTAVMLGAAAEAELRRVTVDIDGVNTSSAITLGYGTGTGVLNAYRCKIDVDDTDADIVNGLAYLSGSGDQEYFGNDIHVTCGGAGKVAYGFLCTSATALTVRGMFNHLHIEDGGGTSYAMSIGANCTVVSQFDDLIADDGIINNGTLTQINSPSDGSLTATGTITANEVISGILNTTTSATIAIADIGLATVGNITIKTTATIADIDITGGSASALTVSNIEITDGVVASITGVATALTVSTIEITAGVVAGISGVADALTISNIEITAGLATALTVSNIDITAGDATTLTIATLDVTTRSKTELATIASLTVTTTANIALATIATLSVTTDIYTVAWYDYGGSSTIVGFSDITRKYIFIKKIGKTVFVQFEFEGTSDATNFIFSLPYARTSTPTLRAVWGFGMDNTTLLTAPGRVSGITGSLSSIALFKDMASGAWTASGAKRASGQFFYETS